MKELELTSNAALTDAVYETALNGSFLEVKLVAGSVGDDEPRGMQPEYECYHISYPDKKDTILFEQPLDAADDKVTVYDLGKKIKSIEGCCHKTLTKGESRTATARKVVAHGPMWIYVAIAIGMDKTAIAPEMQITVARRRKSGYNRSRKSIIRFSDENAPRCAANFCILANANEMQRSSATLNGMSERQNQKGASRWRRRIPKSYWRKNAWI